MNDTEKCADRIDAEWDNRAGYLRELFAQIDRAVDTDDDETLDDARDAMYGMAAGVTKNTLYTMTWSGGGPADYLEVEVDEVGEVVAARYRFTDWFDGAVRELEGADLELARRYATETLGLDA